MYGKHKTRKNNNLCLARSQMRENIPKFSSNYYLII